MTTSPPTQDALEPRGCPLPGACACPAPMTPDHRAAIICDFMGWTKEGPAWTDAHKLAASLSGDAKPSTRTLQPLDEALATPINGEDREVLARIIDPGAWHRREQHLSAARESDQKTEAERESIRELAAFEVRDSCSKAEACMSAIDGNAEGAAEREVGRYVYRLISARMNSKAGTPEGVELAYLAAIVSDVEEYGADELLSDADLAALPPSPVLADACLRALASREQNQGLSSAPEPSSTPQASETGT